MRVSQAWWLSFLYVSVVCGVTYCVVGEGFSMVNFILDYVREVIYHRFVVANIVNIYWRWSGFSFKGGRGHRGGWFYRSTFFAR